MRTPRRPVGPIVAAALLLAIVARAEAETCKLEIKRIDTTASRTTTGVPAGYMFRSVYPQHFYMQIRSGRNVVQATGDAKFSDVIKKEPKKYVSEHPFRGVAELGGRHYGFVLDTAEPEKGDAEAEKSKKAKEEEKVGPVQRYNRFYFDVNHNGDLTDDKVIEAENDSAVRYPTGYAHYTFPRVDLTLDVEGTKVDYSFTFSVYAHTSASYQYASASLNAAA